MEFKPSYHPDHKNEINLQDLSQRVREYKENFQCLSDGTFEKMIGIIILSGEVRLLKSKINIIGEIKELEKNSDYGHLHCNDIETGQRLSLQRFKKLLHEQEEKNKNSDTISDGLPILGSDNPAWPIHYYFSDGLPINMMIDELKNQLIRIELDESGKPKEVFETIKPSHKVDYQIMEELCFNYLSPIEFGKETPCFDYFFLLKILLISNHDISHIEEFLEFQLQKQYGGEISQFALFLTKAIDNYPDLGLPRNIENFIMNWIDLKVKFPNSSQTKSVDSISEKIGDFNVSSIHLDNIVSFFKPYFDEKKEIETLLRGSKIDRKLTYKKTTKLLCLTLAYMQIKGVISTCDLAQWISDNFKGTYSKKANDIDKTYAKECINDYNLAKVKRGLPMLEKMF